MNQKKLVNLQKKLTPEQYNICFLKGSEPPFSGKYTDNFAAGMYHCVVCNTPLFYSDAKFHSDSGWPSFDRPVKKENIDYEDDYSLGTHRIEVKCNNCGAHLGHVFDDGPTATGKRYCINSLALNFQPLTVVQLGFPHSDGKINQMSKKFPSARTIIDEAIKKNPNADLNQLHALTYELMKKYRAIYYEERVNDFLQRPSLAKLAKNIKQKLKRELLRGPIVIDDVEYSNFMEEAARRMSQTFQTITGNLSELCVENELINEGLTKGLHYVKRKKEEHTDITVYHPNLSQSSVKHRIEVKSMKIRERGTRGLKFDGDSMIGFFNQPSEFTDENIDLIDEHCRETSGFCYIPPKALTEIKNKLKGKRFKSNTDFASDIKKFVLKGTI